MRNVLHRVGVIVLLVGLAGMVLDFLVWLASRSWWGAEAWDLVLGFGVFLAILGAFILLAIENPEETKSRTRQE